MRMLNMFRHRYNLMFVILSGMIYSDSCQVLTSGFHLDRLLKIERTLVQRVSGYIDRQSKHNVTFDASITNFLERARLANEHETYARDAHTPLLGYRVLTRLVKQWPQLKKNMSCTDVTSCPMVTGEDVITNVLKKEANMPTEDDLQAAALAIINVCSVYDFRLDDVTDGRFPGNDDTPLSADDVFYVADAAMQAGKTREAITWFEYLREKLEDNPGLTYEFKLTALYQRLAATYHQHETTSKAVALLKEYLKSDPDNSRISRDVAYFEARARAPEAEENRKTSKRQLRYHRLCQMAAKGEYRMSRLTCQLVPLLHGYGVARLETLSTRPEIQRYHDVISDADAAQWRLYANRTFAELPSPEYTHSSPQALRSGPLCEDDMSKFPLVSRVTARLEQMTGLHLGKQGGVESSLCYQVTNEGNGGAQRPVTDYRLPMEMYDPNTPFRSAGNKIATIILQLSDVAYGGDIVFPKAGLTIPVVKGSAVVVRNLQETGLPDPRATRRNCPVVVGSKWTAEKHVFYTNQIFRRPCKVQTRDIF